ncbi:hypothetical protein ABID22_000124 [Pontibacter aydingkolensis]|uniref:Tail fiber domain-containing protein n=1 Tax=Pontibacter aydingkolensis TaxID=1911536 RepID=A0ABS7CR00_9BACT|nr:tail fiber domain-containing protein [Pontibacter aydingkolensis]MBW7466208.1 tail fiber domain-containing protein [Pontibacter aydingkolensis]
MKKKIASLTIPSINDDDYYENTVWSSSHTHYEIQREVAKMASLVHTHSISDVTGLSDALNGKANITHSHSGYQATITGAATTITSNNLTTNRALISDANGKVSYSAVTSTELGYVSGVTSAIQTQLNSKAASTHTHTDMVKSVNGNLPDANGNVTISTGGASPTFTASRAIISDATGNLAASTVTSTQLGYVAGVTSAIQTQLNGKASTSVATTSVNGLMSSTDKTKLDGIIPSVLPTAGTVVQRAASTGKVELAELQVNGATTLGATTVSGVLSANSATFTQGATVGNILKSHSYVIGTDGFSIREVSAGQSVIQSWNALQLAGRRMSNVVDNALSNVGLLGEMSVVMPVPAADVKGLVIKAAASQTANLLDIWNSNNTSIASITGTGGASFNENLNIRNIGTGSGLHLHSDTAQFLSIKRSTNHNVDIESYTGGNINIKPAGGIVATNGRFQSSSFDTSTTYGNCGVWTGNGDAASYAAHNIKIASWNGIGLHCTLDNTTRHVFDARYGHYSLHGNINAGGSITASGTLSVSNGVGTFAAGGGIYFDFNTTKSGGFYFAKSIRVEGDVVATGNVTANSDARLKTNIREYESGIAKVMQLKPAVYDRTDKESKNEVGFIAQEVQAIEPNIVVGVDTLSLDYSRITVMLTKAVQEQQQMIEELKNEINLLKGESK